MIFKRWPKIFTEEYYSRFLEELWQGLSKIDFANNFQSFEIIEEVLIGGTESVIINKIQTIPKHRIITKQSTAAIIKDGVWDKEYVRIESDIDCVINVIYFA